MDFITIMQFTHYSLKEKTKWHMMSPNIFVLTHYKWLYASRNKTYLLIILYVLSTIKNYHLDIKGIYYPQTWRLATANNYPIVWSVAACWMTWVNGMQARSISTYLGWYLQNGGPEYIKNKTTNATNLIEATLRLTWPHHEANIAPI